MTENDQKRDKGPAHESSEIDRSKGVELHSKSLVKAEPQLCSPQGLALAGVATNPAKKGTETDILPNLVKAEPQQCSPQGLAIAVVATTPGANNILTEDSRLEAVGVWHKGPLTEKQSLIERLELPDIRSVTERLRTIVAATHTQLRAPSV